MKTWNERFVVGALGFWLAACQTEEEPAASAPQSPAAAMSAAPPAYGAWGDPLPSLPNRTEQLARICASPGADLVRDVFCSEAPVPITSLVELALAFRLDPTKLGGITGASLTAASTSLSVRSVSAINPRLIMLRLEVPGQPGMIALSFNRGDQISEIVVRDRESKELKFYLLRFEQACNSAPGGCVPGDLLTPAAESGWLNVSLYDEPALTNTMLDCATCHQPNGPGTPKLLRMQEFDSPWTHWLFKSTPGGGALVDDYTAAKGDESMAGMPRDMIEYSAPGSLQLLVGSSTKQPNMFDWVAVEKEVKDSAQALGGNQPFDNSIPGKSPTWRAAYDIAQRGESIPVPYHNVKITDPAKLARMIEAYQAYQRGELPQAQLPDLRDVFPDDPQLLAEIGIGTEPGLSGEGVLLEACSQCHNARLDQTLSRARFRADLQGLTRAEKDVAIYRLQLPASDLRAMPPARLRVLTPEARERAIEVLQR